MQFSFDDGLFFAKHNGFIIILEENSNFYAFFGLREIFLYIQYLFFQGYLRNTCNGELKHVHLPFAKRICPRNT